MAKRKKKTNKRVLKSERVERGERGGGLPLPTIRKLRALSFKGVERGERGVGSP
jgi:hypothetical protein